MQKRYLIPTSVFRLHSYVVYLYTEILSNLCLFHCGFTCAGQVELEDPVENIGAKLVRQAAAKTNDLAGDGTTTSVVLAQGLIAEGVKVSGFRVVLCLSISTCEFFTK